MTESSFKVITQDQDLGVRIDNPMESSAQWLVTAESPKLNVRNNQENDTG